MERRRVGAWPLAGGGAGFRVWAPRARRVELVLEAPGTAGRTAALEPEGDGYFVGEAAAAGAGTLYRYLLDGRGPFPDPASRFQPLGPHGPSELIDPGGYAWSDESWPGVTLEGRVIYEMHIGTFTGEGTWRAACARLRALAELGISLVELLPVAEFPGRFGWGYDGVDLYAPSRLYGAPDDFRLFIDRAHALGIGVILDVVYNHLGPDGNYLQQFAPEYFSARETEWGQALNFDGPGSEHARAFITGNAAYWVSEFHIDGLRVDATQCLYDESDCHVLADIVAQAREAAGRRSIVMLAENEPQQARMVKAAQDGGCGFDAVWSDDFHHAAVASLTGMSEAYYTDYRGTPQEFISAFTMGFLYQGQHYRWQGKPRGSPTLGLQAHRFVHYLENHDQVANSCRGLRLHQTADPGRLRILTALLLLGPQTPMLFQGQEWFSRSPFEYFADHEPELARLVREGRAASLRQFPSLKRARLPDPADPEVFERSKLDWARRDEAALALHRDLIALRRSDPAFAAQRGELWRGAVIAPEAFALRMVGEGEHRLLVVNLGTGFELSPCPEPLLAPPAGRRWLLQWSSDDIRYGGRGAVSPVDENQAWLLSGHSCAVLSARGGGR